MPPPGIRLSRAIVAAALLVFGSCIVWILFSGPDLLDEEELSQLLPEGFEADAARGQDVFHLGGCAHCHQVTSAESPWPGSLAGGNRLETRFGTFFSPNITTDPETGIGKWSSWEFVNAMVLGVSPAGYHYYPSFPYTSYAGGSLPDLLNLKAYLDTLEPVRSPNSPHDLRFPFNLRGLISIWKRAFHVAEPFEPDPSRSAEWNRGAYIVNTFGHCGACHTPRNLFLAELRDRPLAGSPPLSPTAEAAPAIAGLDRDEVLNALDEWSGAVSEDSAMFLVTATFSQHVSLADIEAVATYLSSLDSH